MSEAETLPTDLGNAIAHIEISLEHLGWAQRYEGDASHRLWRLHEPTKVWRAIKDAIIAADGPDAVAPIAAIAKDQPPDKKLYSIRRSLSAEALRELARSLRKLHREHPDAVQRPPIESLLSAEDIDDIVQLIQASEEDPEIAIALLEELSPAQQAQVAEALSDASPQPELKVFKELPENLNNSKPEEPAISNPPPPPEEVFKELAKNLNTLGIVTVHSLVNEPGFLLGGVGVEYIGGKNRSQGFMFDSPLANPSKIRDKKSLTERDKVCDEHIAGLITCLQVQSGPTWNELKRLALMAREGIDVKLLCYCAPKRCHGEAIAIVVSALAKQTPVTEIIKELQAIAHPVQESLLG